MGFCQERVWDNGDMIDCGRGTPCSLHVPKEAPVHMRRFRLHRYLDETGVSGTGIVAEGVEFTNGMIALTWLSPHRTVTVYESIKTVVQLHGHEGRTSVAWVDS